MKHMETCNFMKEWFKDFGKNENTRQMRIQYDTLDEEKSNILMKV